MDSKIPPQSAIDATSCPSVINSQRSVEPVDFGTTAQLFDEVRDFFALHPSLTQESILKLAYFIFAIQFPECSEIWPFASVLAPDSVGSTLLVRMLAGVCSNPLLLSEITLSALLSLPPQAPRPSLLIIDQRSPNVELGRVLRILSRPGSHILRKGKLHDVSLPTLVCAAEPLRDSSILDQAIHIVITPIRDGITKFVPEGLDGFARSLRGKLLKYRETNLAKIRVSHFDVPQFASPTREIAKMLGRCVVDDSLQRALPMLFEPQDRDSRTRTSDSIPAVEIEAAMFLSHAVIRRKVRAGEVNVLEQVIRPEARVGEIADVANGILEGRGEIIRLAAREVGDHLRALGLFSQRLGSAGRGLRFANENRRKIHQLARAYDVRSTQNNRSCEFCSEIKAAK